MNENEYQNKLKKELEKIMSQYDCEVKNVSVPKVGGMEEGLSFRFPGENTALVIYPKQFLPDMAAPEETARFIASDIIKKHYDVPTVPTNEEDFRKGLIPVLINTDNSEELLRSGALHQKLPGTEDVSMILRCKISESKDGLTSFVVKRDNLSMLGLTESEAFEEAFHNGQQMDYHCKSMFETMKELLGPDVDEMMIPEMQLDDTMYVLTNDTKQYGSTALLYPEKLQEIEQRFNEDFYILPSSVHELLCVPESKVEDPSDLIDMVRSINKTEVAPSEVLSNDVFHFKNGLIKSVSEELRQSKEKTETITDTIKSAFHK